MCMSKRTKGERARVGTGAGSSGGGGGRTTPDLSFNKHPQKPPPPPHKQHSAACLDEIPNEVVREPDGGRGVALHVAQLLL